MKKIIVSLITAFFLSFSFHVYAEETENLALPLHFLPIPFLSLEEALYTATQEIKTTNKPLYGKVIVLDAGHGGKDNGASVPLVNEKEINLSVTLKTRELLETMGAEVHLTRNEDITLVRKDRYMLSEKVEADVFISIHANTGDKEVRGLETFYHYPRDEKLAEVLQYHLTNETYTGNRGTKYGDYYVLRENTVPSVLIEMGFLTNQEDLLKLSSATFQELIAKGVVNGLLEYFN